MRRNLINSLVGFGLVVGLTACGGTTDSGTDIVKPISNNTPVVNEPVVNEPAADSIATKYKTLFKSDMVIEEGTPLDLVMNSLNKGKTSKTDLGINIEISNIIKEWQDNLLNDLSTFDEIDAKGAITPFRYYDDYGYIISTKASMKYDQILKNYDIDKGEFSSVFTLQFFNNDNMENLTFDFEFSKYLKNYDVCGYNIFDLPENDDNNTKGIIVICNDWKGFQ